MCVGYAKFRNFYKFTGGIFALFLGTLMFFLGVKDVANTNSSPAGVELKDASEGVLCGMHSLAFAPFLSFVFSQLI